ncbi:MAG: VTT domain-containing protein [Pseudomonadota bacterium]
MTLEDFLISLQTMQDSAILTFLVIIIATFILEDLATIATALLSSQGIIDPFVGLSALFVGIVVGDCLLYVLGALARRFQIILRFLRIKSVQCIEGWLHRNQVQAIVAARFIPGMRLTCYTACGLFRQNFRIFVLSAICASCVWTSGLFFLSYTIGRAVQPYLDQYRWLIAILAVVLVFAISYLARKLVGKKITRWFIAQNNFISRLVIQYCCCQFGSP